jgi:hypothetical protein
LAQNITVTARIDSTSMWIGEQTKLSFEISQQPNQKVVTPLFSDTIIGGLEIVEPMKADTVSSPDGHLLVTQHYVVTAFEDSLLYIPPYPFVLNGDTTWSKSLSLKVIQPFVIDTASNQVTDIKSVFTPKFYWKGLIRKILIALLILLLIVALVIVVRRLMHKRIRRNIQQGIFKSSNNIMLRYKQMSIGRTYSIGFHGLNNLEPSNDCIGKQRCNDLLIRLLRNFER